VKSPAHGDGIKGWYNKRRRERQGKGGCVVCEEEMRPKGSGHKGQTWRGFHQAVETGDWIREKAPRVGGVQSCPCLCETGWGSVMCL
jgi:hypothetical protein